MKWFVWGTSWETRPQAQALRPSVVPVPDVSDTLDQESVFSSFRSNPTKAPVESRPKAKAKGQGGPTKSMEVRRLRSLLTALRESIEKVRRMFLRMSSYSPRSSRPALVASAKRRTTFQICSLGKEISQHRSTLRMGMGRYMYNWRGSMVECKKGQRG